MAYSGTPTTYGEQKIAAALAGGQPLTVVAIAVGDGGGSPVSPVEGQTALTHEVWRGAISSWGVDPADTRRIVVHVTVPATAGPFVVREAGVYDGAGGLICVTALAATEVVGPGSSNQATSIDLIIAMPIGSAGAITVSPTQGERFTIERLYRTPFISVNSASTTAPSGNPALGDLYIVPAGSTGAWATAGTGKLAEWNGTFWAFLAPPLKMVAGIMDAADDGAAEYIKWNGIAWEPFAIDGVVFTVIDAAGASTSDELVGTTAPGLTALQPNMIFRFRQGAAANTTTAPKANITNAAGVALGDVPLTKADGTPLAAGDLPANADFLTEYDSTGPRHRVQGQRRSDVLALIPPVVATLAPKFFAVSQTIYVAPPGTAGASDSNPGTLAQPLATLAAAYRLGASYFVPGGQVTIQLTGPGTYAAASPPIGCLTPFVISGSTANQDAYVIAGTGVATGVFSHTSTTTVLYSGVNLQNTGNITNTLGIAYGASVGLSYVTLSSTSPSFSQSSIALFQGGNLVIGAGVKTSTNGYSFISCAGGRVANQTGSSLTFVGTPNYTLAVFSASDLGVIALQGISLGGSATGSKWNLNGNSVLDTGGNSANFPGSIAGTKSDNATVI
ncbi:MAG: phage tail protein [Janthinobacterium lividum]